MANHKSALKRIRRNEKVRLRNRYQHKTVRNLIKKFKNLTSGKSEAVKMLSELYSSIDRLAKKNIIHKNKAANLKGKLAKHLTTISD